LKKKPLSEKQQEKQPQLLPQVEESALPKKNHANAPIVDKSSENNGKYNNLLHMSPEGSYLFPLHYWYLIQLFYNL
jgi:hypothetical protein